MSSCVLRYCWSLIIALAASVPPHVRLTNTLNLSPKSSVFFKDAARSTTSSRSTRSFLFCTRDGASLIRWPSQGAGTARNAELQGDRDAMRQAFQEMTAKTNKEIEAVLTKDQLKKFQDLLKQQAEMRQRMRQQRQRNN